MKTKTLVALFVLVALATFCTFGYWRYHYLIDAMLLRQSNPNYGLISPLQSAENQPAPAYDVPQEDEPLPLLPEDIRAHANRIARDFVATLQPIPGHAADEAVNERLARATTRTSPTAAPSGERLADYPRATRSWGDIYNPAGIVPKQGFTAYYLDSRWPERVIASEHRGCIAINYSDSSPFLNIQAEHFGAYWVGTLHVPQPGRYRIHTDLGWARARILLDKHIIAERSTLPNCGSCSVPPTELPLLTLDAGDHLLEVEYNNHWHSAAFQLAFTPDDMPAYRSEDLATALAALKLPPETVVHIAAVHESSDYYNRLTLQAPTDDTPYVLLLSSRSPVNWHIAGRAPLAVVRDNYGDVSGMGDAPLLAWLGQENINYRVLDNAFPAAMPVCHCEQEHYHQMGYHDSVREAALICRYADGGITVGSSSVPPLGLMRQIRKLTGYPLRGASTTYDTSHIDLGKSTFDPAKAAAAAAMERQLEAQRAACETEPPKVSDKARR